jgi:hypothetical protein
MKDITMTTLLENLSLTNTLTVAQKRCLIKELRAEIALDIQMKKEAKTFAKIEKEKQRDAKALLAAQKLQDRIAKAQLRLQKLQDKTKPVGSKAIKANRRASKAVITTAEMLESNEIAKRFAAKKTA